MRIAKHVLRLISISLLLIQIGCTKYPVMQEPDVQVFNKTVFSTSLRDSLQNGKLTKGMPYFVVEQIFKNWSSSIEETKIPVAGLGSKQHLEESEGWNRKYVDPNSKVFLDKYETPNGTLYLWYQRPDFYTMDVSARDTLFLFLKDTLFSSVINCLNSSSVLTTKDSLPQIPVHKSFYAEVHYSNHPWRDISYWYRIEILSNARTFKLDNINYELYPVELIEFNNEPVSSFNWRKENKNEN